MRPDERRALDDLVDQWESASKLEDGEECCHKLCADHLRSTLDRLTDEQSDSEARQSDNEIIDALRRAREACDTIARTLPAAWAKILREHGFHHSPEPPDSTEPEDDVVERVARWLHEKRVTCLAGTSAPEPAISTYRNTARRLLHDTGILTKESETP